MSTRASNNQPTLDEIRDSARVISLPLRTKFRGLLEREIMVFEGPNGFTEWSPFVEYDD
jgi:O-succinylbenzoate synthase